MADWNIAYNWMEWPQEAYNHELYNRKSVVYVVKRFTEESMMKYDVIKMQIKIHDTRKRFKKTVEFCFDIIVMICLWVNMNLKSSSFTSKLPWEKKPI